MANFAAHKGSRPSRGLINFASYDFLGLKQEPGVAAAGKAVIDA
jgi:7-keto-8-aminopelargonate synthetase-like enzyme